MMIGFNNHMDIKKILLTSSWFVFPSVMWANMDYSVVATVSAGPAWNKAGQTQTLLLQPDFFNTYQAKKSTQTIAIGELFLGLQRRVSARLLGQLGLAIAAIFGKQQILYLITSPIAMTLDKLGRASKGNFFQKHSAKPGYLIWVVV